MAKGTLTDKPVRVQKHVECVEALHRLENLTNRLEGLQERIENGNLDHAEAGPTPDISSLVIFLNGTPDRINNICDRIDNTADLSQHAVRMDPDPLDTNALNARVRELVELARSEDLGQPVRSLTLDNASRRKGQAVAARYVGLCIKKAGSPRERQARLR